jgi:hypothetical protein
MSSIFASLIQRPGPPNSDDCASRSVWLQVEFVGPVLATTWEPSQPVGSRHPRIRERPVAAGSAITSYAKRASAELSVHLPWPSSRRGPAPDCALPVLELWKGSFPPNADCCLGRKSRASACAGSHPALLLHLWRTNNRAVAPPVRQQP